MHILSLQIDVIEVYLKATPWALPLTGLSAVLLACLARALGRWLRVRPWLAWLYGMSIAGYLTVTATPAAGDFHSRGNGFNWSLPPTRGLDFFRVDNQSLNIWIAIPMAFLSVVVAGAGGRRIIWIAPWAAPFVVEVFQNEAPLGRAAFLFADVFTNWVGSFAGTVAGFAFLVLGGSGLRVALGSDSHATRFGTRAENNRPSRESAARRTAADD